MKVRCPECNGTNVEALLRGTGFERRKVRGIRDGRLVLSKRVTQSWADDMTELDEELKCRDCGSFPNINDLGIGQDDFTVGT